MFEALPCFTQIVPDRWIGQSYGETKVLPPREHFNLHESIPFDTNYGPTYAMPFLPLIDGLGNTFVAPMAKPKLPSTFVSLPYEVVQPWTLRAVPEEFQYVAKWKQ